MFVILLFFISGILSGFILRKKKKLIKISENFLMVSIYLLLFFLGFGIGNNNELISSFHVLGLKALLISFAGVFGSIFLSTLLEKFIDKRNEK
ncbi:MAG: LysO family transporter [bacterium]|nr:LysO family transporter [bacterium]